MRSKRVGTLRLGLVSLVLVLVILFVVGVVRGDGHDNRSKTISTHVRLLRAAHAGDLALVKQIVTEMKQVIKDKNQLVKQLGKIDNNYKTAVHYAVIGSFETLEKRVSERKGEHHQVLRYLLENGAPRVFEDVLCPLHDAVSYRDSKSIEILLRGTNKSHYCLNQRDIYNQTVMHIASRSKSSGIARYFLKNFDSIGAITDEATEVLKVVRPTQKRPGEYHYQELTDALLDWDVRYLHFRGADINVVDNSGYTPLFFAVEGNRVTTIDYLIQNAASITHRGKWNQTALHIAAVRDFTGAIELLLAADSTLIDAVDSYGRTSLMLASMNGYKNTVKLLIEKGANLDMRDKRNMTAIDYAVKGDYQEVVLLLKPYLMELVVDSTTEATEEEEEERLNASEKGGWLTVTPSYKELKLSSTCTIERRSPDITAEEFLRDYLRVNKPVIISGLSNDWPAKQAWSRSLLLANHGRKKFKVSSIPYGLTYGGKAVEMTLEDFVTYMDRVSQLSSDAKPTELPQYIFDSSRTAGEFVKDIQTPAIFSNFTTVLSQWMIGPIWSGAQPHFHGDAFNGLVFGEKHWFLFPPKKSFFTSKHVLQWYEEDYPSLEADQIPLECLQKPGDVVFVPAHWGHAVINTQQSIAVAIEFEAAEL